MRSVIPIVLAALLAGCARSSSPNEEAAAVASPAAPASGTAAPASATPPPAPVKPVPAEIPNVVARVNGEEINKSDFESAVRSIESREGGPVPPTERDRVFRGVLDELIAYRLLLQESRSRKVAVPDADVDARMREVQKQFPSEQEFKQMLQARNLTPQQIRGEMRNQLVVRRLLESEVNPKIGVSQEEITTFYKRNTKQFEVPERVRASHILIAFPAGADAAAKATAMSTATGVLKKARGGADFAALAREFSQDPSSAASGGDLGFFQQGKMVGPFNDVAFSLMPGQISDVVETEYGYHIIKVSEKQPGRTMSLEEAQPQIDSYLKNINRQKETQAFVRALRSKGKVEVFL